MNYNISEIVKGVKNNLYYIIIPENEFNLKISKDKIHLKRIISKEEYSENTYLATSAGIRKLTKIEKFLYENGGK